MSRPEGIPATWHDQETDERAAFRHCWAYRPAPGAEPLGYVARFERADGGKLVVPFFKLNGAPGRFKAGAAAEPRPLFGLDRLDAPGPLFVVEGEKDASALHRLGLAAVTAPGGSKAADRADWQPLRAAIAAGRRVLIWPDADGPGRAYAVSVADQLADACACVVEPPAGLPAIEGAGAADWLAAALAGAGFTWDGFGELPDGAAAEAFAARLAAAVEAVAAPVPDAWRAECAPPPARAVKREPQAPPPYVVTERGTFRIVRRTRGEDEEVQECMLANFSARIVAEIVRDDGQERARAIVIAGRCAGAELAPVTLTAEQFAAMNWPLKEWGSRCNVSAERSAGPRLREAIQLLSHADGAPPERVIYTHTGWREVDGAGWCYLSAGAVVGAAGAVDGVAVELDRLGSLYALPAPSTTAAERLEAARASMATALIAPDAVCVPLLGAVYLAPLFRALQPDLLLWLQAPSGAMKSSLCAVMAAHYGAGIDLHHLPAQWSDTAVTLEGKLFTLADALAVIDDYAPQRTAIEQAKLDQTAERVIRSAGNLSARGRSNADLSRRADRPPRGLCVSTAEQWPTGESATRRLFGLSMRKGDVRVDALDQAQRAAGAGLLARTLADYVQGLAADYPARTAAALDRWRELRRAALDAGFTDRMPAQLAFLMLGYEAAVQHWQTAGALDAGTAAVLCAEGWQTLQAVGRAHARRVLAAQPAEAFRATLADLLAAGDAHLLDKDSATRPGDNAAAYGWRGTLVLGRQVGWVSETDGNAYLIPKAAFAVVAEALHRMGAPLALREAALWQQLRDRGWLLPGNEEAAGDGDMRSRDTRRIAVYGQTARPRLLVMPLSALRGS